MIRAFFPQGLWLVFAAICVCPGCSAVDHKSAGNTAGLSWLALWAGAPLETGPAFDPEVLKPTSASADLAPDSLLEITVWDLYEPDKPHTFPVRISSDATIDLPMLDPLSTSGLSLRQIEDHIAQRYRDGAILKSPRVLVRSLDPASVRVAVTGAVNRAGAVDLPRGDATVFAALMASGGLKKNAGSHIGLLRRNPETAVTTAASTPAQASDTPATTTTRAVQRANSLEPITVAQAEAPADKPTVTTIWYDLKQEADRQAIRSLTLQAGDSLTVKASQSPVRIGGDVVRPGPLALPLEGTIDVWQALERAGGPVQPDVPFQVVLVKPAADGHGNRRWSRTVNSWSEHPPSAPEVQPGDAIHLESTGGKGLKTAVHGLWN